jgi:ADP-ribose pyrophosphatase YjhB (NUDIX family)
MKRAVRAIVARDGKVLVMSRNKFGHQYNVLIGGGVKFGENLEHALMRELDEECGFKLKSARLVLIENAGFLYGTQYVYLCEVEGDQPKLAPDSDEARIHVMGKNLYTPRWIPLEEFAAEPFRSEKLKDAILHGLKHGFEGDIVELDDRYLANILKRKGG